MNKIIEIAEKLDWSVDISEDYINFSTFSPAGQDFNVDISYDKDLELEDLYAEIGEKLYEYYKSYDPDYEASLWIGDDGHGKNGAPYKLSDLLKDMEWREQAILELYNGITKLY